MNALTAYGRSRRSDLATDLSRDLRLFHGIRDTLGLVAPGTSGLLVLTVRPSRLLPGHVLWSFWMRW